MFEDLVKLLNEEYNVLHKNLLFDELFNSMEMNLIDDKYYITSAKKGVEVVFSLEKVLITIFLMSDGYNNCDEYVGDMPLGISFNMNRVEIQKKLQAPYISGGGQEDRLLFNGIIPYWDLYVYDNYSLNIQYRNIDGLIDLITISSVEVF